MLLKLFFRDAEGQLAGNLCLDTVERCIGGKWLVGELRDEQVFSGQSKVHLVLGARARHLVRVSEEDLDVDLVCLPCRDARGVLDARDLGVQLKVDEDETARIDLAEITPLKLSWHRPDRLVEVQLHQPVAIDAADGHLQRLYLVFHLLDDLDHCLLLNFNVWMLPLILGPVEKQRAILVLVSQLERNLLCRFLHVGVVHFHGESVRAGVLWLEIDVHLDSPDGPFTPHALNDAYFSKL